MNRSLKHILGIVVSVCTVNFLFAQQANFQGNWAINKSKTVFNDTPEWTVPFRIEVSEGTSISIQRFTMDKDNNEVTYNEKFNNDHGTCESTLSSGGKRKASILWDHSKSGFVIASTSTDLEGNLSQKIRETWSLEDGGKTLVLNRNVEQSNGFLYSIKAYYNKN
ncbi:MAG: hypothetical protein JWP37_598 [Mucilaginibacter sp.]|nr:hypothetical protein [Mucilaginibacter sp.]